MSLHSYSLVRLFAAPCTGFRGVKTASVVQPLQYTLPVQRRTQRLSMMTHAQQTFFLDEFAQKQFNDSSPDYSGTRIHFDQADFVVRVQQYHQAGKKLVDGYAPFCKHIFVPNFTGAKQGSLAINQTNRQLLRTGYSRRRPEELPVLSRHVFKHALVYHQRHCMSRPTDCIESGGSNCRTFSRYLRQNS